MRLRNIKNADEIVNNSKYVINEIDENTFKNNNPIYLEIGMGKGDFIINNAIQNPNINYIGIEKYKSVLVKAVQKLEDKEIGNLKIICMDAKEINVLNTKIDLLYLNFSDPWPKKRHALRRLTSPIYLEKYENIFKDKKHIIMKTDNRKLFEYSIKSFTDYGYKIEDICLDLYKENIEDNIPTEYEKKFRDKGPIYKIEVTK